MHLKISSAKWRPFYPGGDELKRFHSGNTFVEIVVCVWLTACIVYFKLHRETKIKNISNYTLIKNDCVRMTCWHFSWISSEIDSVTLDIILWNGNSKLQLHGGTVNFCITPFSLQWRHNGCDGVSNHRRLHCLIDYWFKRWTKKTSKLRHCAGNSPVNG